MAEIRHTFKCNCKEISVDCNGSNYLIICGKHINGAYCAFPKRGVAAELAAYDGYYSYNKNMLFLAFSKRHDCPEVDEDTIAQLATVITDTIQELPDVLPF